MFRVYPQAPKQFLFGITLQNSKHEPQKGTTLGLMGRGLEVRRFRVQRFRGSEVQWFRSLGLGIYRR